MMGNKRSIQEARAKLISRKWVCQGCGAIIYYGKLTPPEKVSCPCGKGNWRSLQDKRTSVSNAKVFIT